MWQCLLPRRFGSKSEVSFGDLFGIAKTVMASKKYTKTDEEKDDLKKRPKSQINDMVSMTELVGKLSKQTL